MRHTSIILLKKKADENDIRSLELLGWEYSAGKRVRKSYREAFQCYTRSVILGSLNPNVFYNIEIMYWYGRGVKRDIRKSFLWAWKGALLGDPDCMTATGYNYLRGEGTIIDIDKARYWYRKARDCDPEQTPAIYSLGCIAFYIDKNYESAFSLFSRAYQIDHHLNSAYMIGRMSAFGLGCEQNLKSARTFLKRASREGHARAARLLKSNAMTKTKRYEKN